jgi:nitrite reductase/ring-hydroxylating ferredoxin subunit
MPVSILWHPVVSTRALRAGDNVLACTVIGQDLALWRSATGQVQAWEDRCPHRGVALSLGRVTGDRLACAYHGWEYAAGTGRCEVIPALPDIPVPGKVCVRTFAAREHQGMVWVMLADDPAREPAADAITGVRRYLRSIGVRAPLGAVNAQLPGLGFEATAPLHWQGKRAGQNLQLLTLQTSATGCMLHLSCDDLLPADAVPALFGAMRRLRSALETSAA